MQIDSQSSTFLKNPAGELLCRLLRFDENNQTWIYSLTTEEWNEITVYSLGTDLAPLLFLHLKDFIDTDRIDPIISKQLRESFNSAGTRSLLWKYDLSRILKVFNQNQIQTILLKGSHLAEEIYHNPALRPMTDVDILVPKDSLIHAASLLQGLGYQPKRAYIIDLEISTSHQLPIFIQPGHFPIELHWNIISPALPYQIDLKGIWDRKRNFSCNSEATNILSIEDTILHLAMHTISQHKLTGSLRFVYDFAAAIQAYKNDVDWATLLERSKLWNVSSSLFLMCKLSQDLFGINVPPDFFLAIYPPNYDVLWDITAKELLFVNTDSLPKFSRNLASFLSAESLIQKFRLATRRLFPPREEMLKTIPNISNNRSRWTNYPHYLTHLMKKHFRSFARILRRDKSISEEARLANMLQQREEYLEKVIF